VSGDPNKDSSIDTAAALSSPSPPRFWWLKRLTAAFVIFIGALIAFDAWWSHKADRRFSAEIAAIRARGEPVAPEDFDASPIPDAQNAAISLQSATAMLASSSSKSVDDALEVAANGDFDTDGWMNDARNTVTQFTPSLRLARQARAQAGVDWKLKLRSPVLNSTVYPYLSTQRALARLLKASARYHHAVGEDREAVAAARDMLYQSHAIARGPSMLIVHLVTIGLEAIACQAVERITLDPPVVTGGPTSTPAATRREVQGLIAGLTDDAQFAREAQRAWQGERMQLLDATRSFFPFGIASSSNLAHRTRPVFELDGLRAATEIEQCAAAAAQPNWPAAKAALPPDRSSKSMSDIEGYSTIVSGILVAGAARTVVHDFRALVERRASALRLAIWLYRIDHARAYPRTLDELVPMYLPAVPVDPYAADGRPMSYRAGAPFPAVWSVGLNGVDDGGTSLPQENAQVVTVPRWECADIVYPLERMAPATRPSSETQNSH
jgi:hypothetical protein